MSIESLRRDLLELEETLIPYGLHVVGQASPRQERADMLSAVALSSHELKLSDEQALQLPRRRAITGQPAGSSGGAA
jgi:cobalamin biosynthesis Mg chelatase CobN